MNFVNRLLGTAWQQDEPGRVSSYSWSDQMTTTKEAKVRIYQLAKDLDVDTNVLLDISKVAGFDKVRSRLSIGDYDQIAIVK